MPNVSFSVTSEEAKLIDSIAHRAAALAAQRGGVYPVMEASMDITAVHANGNPLRLAEMATADDFNFSHDVFGIHRYIDRRTGRLTHFFLPRFSTAKTA